MCLLHTLRKGTWDEISVCWLPKWTNWLLFFSSISHNDKGMVNISVIEEELEVILNNNQLPGGNLPCLHGDNMHEPSTVVVNHNNKQVFLHDRCDINRTSQDNIHGSVLMLNARLCRKNSWKLLALGERDKYHLFNIFLHPIATLALEVIMCLSIGLRSHLLCMMFEQLTGLLL